jgi:hypothetical protein
VRHPVPCLQGGTGYKDVTAAGAVSQGTAVLEAAWADRRTLSPERGLGRAQHAQQRARPRAPQVTTAVLDSVNAGWNVVDTAANYRGPGRAEAAIGEAMQACARPRARPGSAAAVQLHALCPPAVPGAVRACLRCLASIC